MIEADAEISIKKLIAIAVANLPHSYAPYSHFKVSAALLTEDNQVYLGNNIENAAYSPSMCAERVAFCQAVREGKRSFKAIVICGGREGIIMDYCPPCGVCRQVMMEFVNPGSFQIILAKSEEEYEVETLESLLPRGFGPLMLS